MKKKIILILLVCCVGLCITIAACLLSYYSNRDEALIEHLQRKYEQEFIVNGEIKDPDKGVLYAYSVSPIDNKNIVFEAGKRREKIPHPLVLPIDFIVFYDNFLEGAKNSIIPEIIPEEPFYIHNADEIPELTETIYALIENINSRLEDLGFSTTGYTTSINVPICAGKKVETLRFWLDKADINVRLRKFYYQ